MKITVQIIDAIIQCTNNRFLINLLEKNGFINNSAEYYMLFVNNIFFSFVKTYYSI